MPLAELTAFLFFVSLGAVTQAITGFAMGLIIMGAVTALALADISFSAAVVSLIALVNTSLALRRSYRFIDRRILAGLITGLLPATAAGVFLLEALSSTFYDGLRLALGIVIILAGGLLMIRPTPFAAPSGRMPVVATGFAGGIIGGLYGAGGAPMAWLMYRQPIDFQAIRATLLATFFASTLVRSTTVALSGHMPSEILITFALSVPLVVASTIAGVHLAPRVPETLVRRAAFGLLVMLGAFLIFQSLQSLSSIQIVSQ